MKFASRTAIAMLVLAVLAFGTAAFAGTYAGAGPISIPSAGAGSPYPSNATVSGALGTVMDVNATITDFRHTWPDDVDILLQGPTGANVMLLSDAGGSLDVVDVDLTFDDAAAGTAPDGSQIASGTYKPSNYPVGFADTMPAPAPAAPHGSSLAAFNGTDANGTWKLFVADDLGGDLGTIASWSLNIRSCLLPEVVAVTDTTPAGPVVAALLCS